MSTNRHATLDGYTITRATEDAICVSKANVDTWLPRSACLDGDALDEGDTDIAVARWLVIREDLATDD